jgi:hypothetical protein
MKFQLNPHIGADPLMFGMSRDVVRAILSSSELLTKSAEPENDFYIDEGLILGYDESDELEYIEFTLPSSVGFSNVNYFDDELSVILEKMNMIIPGVKFEDGGYNYKPLGIAIYSPLGKVESVSIYREGYYGP